MKADVVIVGSGPAGIFTALELIKNGSKKKIIMVEKGSSIHKRNCPKSKTKNVLDVNLAILQRVFQEPGHFRMENCLCHMKLVEICHHL